MTLSSTESIATWASQTGELWTLVVLNTESFVKALSNMKQLDANIVQYIERNAEKAFANLDAETAPQAATVPAAE